MTETCTPAFQCPATVRPPVRTYALRALSGVLLLLSLSGCGSILNTWTDNSGNLVAAAPLCEDVTGSAVAPDGTCKPYTRPATTADVKPYLGLVINESENNCGKFVTGLVLAANTTNTSLDLLTTVFTALGTAFTPLGTVHALAAAGSVSSGWKTAIDSDIYAKATIANYAQAIQTSYYTDMKTYMADLDNSDITKIVPEEEVAKIRSIHKECSLASAQNTISATVGSSQSSQSPQAPNGNVAGGAINPTAQANFVNLNGVQTRLTIPGHSLR